MASGLFLTNSERIPGGWWFHDHRPFEAAQAARAAYKEVEGVMYEAMLAVNRLPPDDPGLDAARTTFQAAREEADKLRAGADEAEELLRRQRLRYHRWSPGS